MAHQALDLRHLPKTEAYRELLAQARAVLQADADPVCAMATMSCLVHHAFGHLWTGFYRVVGSRMLRVGPYQGGLACLEIEFGRGVCGTAAQRRQTVIVPDVAMFGDHIVCDARSRSEIVVPVFDSARQLIAVLDVDSEQLARFDEVDAAGLEQLVGWFGV